MSYQFFNFTACQKLNMQASDQSSPKRISTERCLQYIPKFQNIYLYNC